MARLLRMPEVAANATEAVLQEWNVEEGATFSAQDPIATVETEKAVVDIDEETDGVVLKRLVPPGSAVEVGAPIAVLGDPGEEVADLDALLADLEVAPAAADGTAPARPPLPDPEGGTADAGTDMLPESAPAQQVAATNGHTRKRIFASPLARRLAREAGLSVEEIRGSGPHGRIVRRDVEAAIASHESSAREAAVAAAPAAGEGMGRPVAPAPGTAVAAAVPPSPYTEIRHSKMRRAIAARLIESKQTVPHFYLRATIDARRLLKLREELNDAAQEKVSVNDLVLKAVARAHVTVPDMNVTWAAEALRRYSTVDVALAVATDRGLVTPVLRGVDTLSISAVAAATKDLSARARSGRLRQEELEGGTIGVTNLGMFGSEEFAAIINPPQAAILAVGAVREEPVARKGKVRVRPVMHVTLSVDHRPVDGVVAARWMRELVSLMEKPVRILA